MVEVIHQILDAVREHGATVEQGPYDIDGIREDDGKVHLIWGTVRPPDVYACLAGFRNVFFVENGWLTQSSGCYIDPHGPNALSSIRDAVDIDSPCDPEMVAKRVKDLHMWEKATVNPRGEDHIFVPLQVEKDTQLLYFSRMEDTPWDRRIPKLVNDVCEAFPTRRIVFKVHPRRQQDQVKMLRAHPAVKRHGSCGIIQKASGSSYQWLARASAVVGINSTVLIESLTFFNPTYAIGEGLFSGNGVMLEDGPLEGILDHEVDHDLVLRFLTHLFRRQIPYRLKPADASRYDVLWDMICQARNPSSQEQVIGTEAKTES